MTESKGPKDLDAAAKHLEQAEALIFEGSAHEHLFYAVGKMFAHLRATIPPQAAKPDPRFTNERDWKAEATVELDEAGIESYDRLRDVLAVCMEQAWIDGQHWGLERAATPSPAKPPADGDEPSDEELRALELMAMGSAAEGERVKTGRRALFRAGRAHGERRVEEVEELIRRARRLERIEAGARSRPCTCKGEGICGGCMGCCSVCEGDALNGCDACGGTGRWEAQQALLRSLGIDERKA